MKTALHSSQWQEEIGLYNIYNAQSGLNKGDMRLKEQCVSPGTGNSRILAQQTQKGKTDGPGDEPCLGKNERRKVYSAAELISL